MKKEIDKYGFDDDNEIYKNSNQLFDSLEKLLQNLIDTAPNDIKWPDRKNELTVLLNKLKEYKNA